MSDQPGQPSVTPAEGRHAGPRFKIERVFGSTFRTFTANVVPFVTIAALLEAPTIALNVAARNDFVPGKPPDPSWAFVFAFLLGMVTPYLISGTLTYGVFKHLRGEEISWTDCLSRGIRKLPAALGTALLVGLATAVGVMLCIVPGMIVIAVYAVAVPAAVVEGNGVFPSMARSKSLTRGYGWPVFGALFLVGLLVGVPNIVLTLALKDDPLLQVLSTSAWQTFGVAFQAVLACVIYYQLRESKEDLDAPELAAVFD